MPYNIVKSKGGWRVMDDKGNYYSKKALTKTRARLQQKALYASESRQETLTGKGYCTYIDDGGNYHILLQGGGFFGDIFAKVKSVGNRIIKTLKPFVPQAITAVSSVISKGIRNDYPPSARETLAKYGQGQVYSLMIMREPIQSLINNALNAITAGKWNEAKRKYNYDNLFHLSMVASLAMPTGDKVNVKIEKNEVINITTDFKIKAEGVSSGLSQHGSGKNVETMPVPVACCITLQEMMDKAQQSMGSSFFLYDAFKNNCQNFIMGILNANGLNTPEVQGFVLQPLESLLQELPSYTSPFANLITNIAGLADRVLQGRGDELEGGCMCMEAKGIRLIGAGRFKNLIRRYAKDLKEQLSEYREYIENYSDVMGHIDRRTDRAIEEISSIGSSDSIFVSTRVSQERERQKDNKVEEYYRCTLNYTNHILDQLEYSTESTTSTSDTNPAEEDEPTNIMNVSNTVVTDDEDPTGSGKITFKKQLQSIKMKPETYLRIVRKIANSKGYDGRAIEFSDKPEKKLMIYDDNGKKVYFGQTRYNDYIIWKHLNSKVADTKRKQYLARATKIKGDWKDNKFSPNTLAINILW